MSFLTDLLTNKTNQLFPKWNLKTSSYAPVKELERKGSQSR